MLRILKKLLSKHILAASVLTLAVIFSFVVYSTFVYKNLKDETISTLREASHQTAVAMKNQINGSQTSIEDVALTLSNDKRSTKEILETLKKVTVNHRLLRMGISSPSGEAYTTDDRKLDLAGRHYLEEALKGNSSLSDRLIDVVDGGIITVFAAPIYDYDTNIVTSVLFGTYSMKEYQASLFTPLFGGKGYSYVIKRNGDAISASSNGTGESEFDNIFVKLNEMSPKNQQMAMELEDGISNNLSSYLEYISQSPDGSIEKRYMYYIPLGINDWYLITVVPVDVLSNKMIFILTLTAILGIFIIAASIFMLALILNSHRKSRIALEETLYVNKITGNRTYEKFKVDAMAILNENKSVKYALISLDVDKFKFINDMFGYEEGDNLIRFIDGVLIDKCKNGELSAHISADNFILLLRYRDKERLCQRLIDIKNTVEEYNHTKGYVYNIAVSMGIYEIEGNETDMDVMKDRSEIPRKQIKHNRIKPYAFYDENVRKKLLLDRDMENGMYNALEKEEYIVLYQPKYWVEDGSLAGAEALVRWQKKDKGLLSPDTFIPLFEENGFITELDKYVFTRMCKDIKSWIDEGYKAVPISSNLSRKNIAIENLAGEYESIVNKYGVSKDLVSLELTETAFIENECIIGDFVDKMRDKGFSVIMDDFGTGFSSLGLLMNIDIDTLKIDRSLIQSIDKNHKARTIVEVGIQLLHQWDTKVNAEGVETLQQYMCLKQLKCDEAQGYYFAKPMPEEDFRKLLKKL